MNEPISTIEVATGTAIADPAEMQLMSGTDRERQLFWSVAVRNEIKKVGGRRVGFSEKFKSTIKRKFDSASTEHKSAKLKGELTDRIIVVEIHQAVVRTIEAARVGIFEQVDKTTQAVFEELAKEQIPQTISTDLFPVIQVMIKEGVKVGDGRGISSFQKAYNELSSNDPVAAGILRGALLRAASVGALKVDNFDAAFPPPKTPDVPRAQSTQVTESARGRGGKGETG